MQVRLTVEDGGVAGPGGHDEDVDELMRMLMLLLMLMLMLMLRLMVMLLAQMVMMLHLQCPVVKMFPLSSIFQNISKGIIPNMRRWRHAVRDIGKKGFADYTWLIPW